MRTLWLTLVLLGCSETPSEPPVQTDTEQPDAVMPVKSCEVVLEHTPRVPSLTVEVAGSFTDWEPVTLTESEEGGTWTVSLGELAPGHYPHKFIYGGLWDDAPFPGSPSHWEGNVENLNLFVPDCQQPSIEVVSADASPEGTVAIDLQFTAAVDGAVISSVEATLGSETVDAVIDEAAGTVEIRASELAIGKHSLRLKATDAEGREVSTFLPLWVEETPFDWRDGLMYFAMVDRFRNGDFGVENPVCSPADNVSGIANVSGGDLKGILDAMEESYFEELGVKTLWLSPVYENPEGGYLGMDGVNLYTGYHGYWPTASREVETCLGDVEADSTDRLRQVVETAHGKGQRVLLDLVLNHVHQDHPWVTEHPDWFSESCVCGSPGCDWEERRLDCLFADYLPDLNYRNHEVVEQVISDVIWWMETYDIDAFRIDAAKHMDDIIIKNLRLRLEEVVTSRGGAEVYLVGETFTGGDGHGQIARYIGPDLLHGQFDFPLYWALRGAFAWGGSLRDLDNAVLTSEAVYGDALMSPFLGNHDVARTVTELVGNGQGPFGSTPDLLAGGGDVVTESTVIDRLTMGLAVAMTQPGVPLLYYGDEIGLAGAGDPDNRRVMNFDPYLSANQEALRAKVRAIGTARSTDLALRRGDRTTLWVDDSLYVYARHTDGGDLAIVAVNTADSGRSQLVGVPLERVDGWTGTDILGDSTLTVSSAQVTIELPARGAAVWVRQP